MCLNKIFHKHDRETFDHHTINVYSNLSSSNRPTEFEYTELQRCKKCGKIFHMENQVADSFINEISESQGFNISKAETTLYGLCAQCK